MSNDINRALAAGLWQIHRRSEQPLPWQTGSDFPWDDPDFGRRTLTEHLDESHGAASRNTTERMVQLDWLWEKLGLQRGMHLLDVTCGPGLYAVELARRGCHVTGIDINPAAIAYANNLAAQTQVADRCTFIQGDVRQMPRFDAAFGGALLLYEQLAVYARPEAEALLANIAAALQPDAYLCVELLDQTQVDRQDGAWWFTDRTGLWGDAPFLHLGERIWNEAQQASIERYHILHLETGELKQYTLFDQTYAVETMVEMMTSAGFQTVDVYLAWAGLPLYDANEWVVYIARR